MNNIFKWAPKFMRKLGINHNIIQLSDQVGWGWEYVM